jgi:hypothetical protein
MRLAYLFQNITHRDYSKMYVSGLKNVVSTAAVMFIIKNGLLSTITTFLRSSKPRNQKKSMRNNKNRLL